MPLKHSDQSSVVNAVRLALSLFLLVLASCAPDPLEGRVVLSGSATLAALATAATDQWRALHPRAEARVESIGSDAGLERLIRFGDADFALVSRPLTPADQRLAATTGQELVALPLGWDAVCLVVSPANTWAQGLTREQAIRGFSTAVRWSDLDESWPSVPLSRFAMGPQSGTAEVLAAALFAGDKGPIFGAANVQASEDDHILARGVAEIEGSLGFISWATYRKAAATLKLLSLDGVLPSTVSVRDRSYGLPRPLWLVGTRQTLARPAPLSLVRLLYERYPALTAEFGLVSMTDEERAHVDALLAEFPTR